MTAALFPTAGAHTAEDGLSIVTAGWMAEHLAYLGARPRYASGFQGIGQLPGAMAIAVNAIASGAADYVLMYRALHNPPGRYHVNPMRQAAGARQGTAPAGFFGPLATIALPYNEYLQRYGATRQDMAAVVVEARKNGARLPWSHWHKQPLSRQEYLAAPMLADPVCRYDCDIPVDGVAAFVLTSARRARDLRHRPVYVAGYASGMQPRRRLPMHWPLDDIMDGGTRLARELWEHTGIGPGEVDLPQVYDGFSPFVWFWLEVLGLCPPGEAHRLPSRRAGSTATTPALLLALSGGGGALGTGRMHGVPQMLECYLPARLARAAASRQRATATVGVAKPVIAAQRRRGHVHAAGATYGHTARRTRLSGRQLRKPRRDHLGGHPISPLTSRGSGRPAVSCLPVRRGEPGR